MDECEFVNVAIRIKPVTDIENPALKVVSNDPPTLVLLDKSQSFVFDHIFTEEVTQESVYNNTIKEFIDNVKRGFNCTVFAYGQTGTGKTYTMGTNSNVNNSNEFGLISRALNDFFDYNNGEEDVEIFLSFIEIYNEKVFDLLRVDTPQLLVKGLKVVGCSKEKVFNAYDAKSFLNTGNKNRHTAGTLQNPNSSRSHAIFTIHCNVKHKDKETSAKLNLVDLAGCESVKKTGTRGSTFQEGININRGLLSIGLVMTALSNNANYIPYRESIITSILQDSLNKQNYISLIACVSPLAEDMSETVQTLEFAQRVKKFKSRPEINRVSRYQRDLPKSNANTPFKRPLPFQTPRPVKQIKTKTNDIVLSEDDRSSVFSSSNGSSVLSVGGADLTQQALSPVIKKYMEAMETSLFNKLELVIKSTVKRPSRENNFKNHGEPSTPCLPWNQVQNEIVKVVKSEIAQFTISKSFRATSSPIGEQMDNVRKVLSFNNSQNEENEFKVPEIPLQKNKKSSALSPIENLPIHPRRSMRLSIKRMSQNLTRNIRDLEASMEVSSFFNETIKPIDKNDNKENKSILGTTNKAKLKKTNKVLSVIDTPVGKRLLNKETRSDSPCTAHTKSVLDSLNSDDTKEVQKLHSIGPKFIRPN